MKTQFKATLFVLSSLLVAAIAAIACTSSEEYASQSELAAVQERAAANETSIGQLTARLDELNSKLAMAEEELAMLSMEMTAMMAKPSETVTPGMQSMPEPRFTRETATDGQRAKIEKAIACYNAAVDHIADPDVRATLMKTIDYTLWRIAPLTWDDAELDASVQWACNPDQEGMAVMPEDSGGSMGGSTGAMVMTPRFDRANATPEQQEIVEAVIYCARQRGTVPAGAGPEFLANEVWSSAEMSSDDDELRMMLLMTCSLGSATPQPMPEPRFTLETATEEQQAKIKVAMACVNTYFDHIEAQDVRDILMKTIEHSLWMVAPLTRDDVELDANVAEICNSTPDGMMVLVGKYGAAMQTPAGSMGGSTGAMAMTPRFDRADASPEQREIVEAVIYCAQERGAIPSGASPEFLTNEVWSSAEMSSNDDELRMMLLMTCAAPGQ